MASLIFQDAIDYSKVRIYNRHLFFFKKNQTAMMSLGWIFFPLSHYEADFSCASDSKKQWFIHEMAHVWQYQSGYCVYWAAFVLTLKGGYHIRTPDKQLRGYYIDPLHQPQRTKLSEFNLEQQADVIAFYFSLYHLNSPRYRYLHPLLDRVMGEFLHNPHQKNLLPATTKIDRIKRSSV